MCLPKPPNWKCHAGRARPVLWGSGCPRSAKCRTERGRNRHRGALREAASQGANKAPGGGWQRLSLCGLGGHRGKAPSSQPRAGQSDTVIAHGPGPRLTVRSQGQLQTATVPTCDLLSPALQPLLPQLPSAHFPLSQGDFATSYPARCELMLPPPRQKSQQPHLCCRILRRAGGLLRAALPPFLQPLAHLQTDRSFSPHEGHVVGETGQYSALRKTGREFRVGTEGS